MGGNERNWLLLKIDDEYADADAALDDHRSVLSGLTLEELGRAASGVETHGMADPTRLGAAIRCVSTPARWGGAGTQPLRLVISSAAAGRTLVRSPTTPKSTSSKIGASSSLLTATMVLEVCMPARCWMAPEMPVAM